MGALISGFFRWFGLNFTRIFEFITGAFGWCKQLFIGFLKRKEKYANLKRSTFATPAFAGVFAFYVSSVTLAFLGLLVVFVNIFSKVGEFLKNMSTGSGGGGSGDNGTIALFYDILNSLGIIKVLSDTYNFWVIYFLIPFLLLLGSILWFKIIMGGFRKAQDLFSIKN